MATALTRRSAHKVDSLWSTVQGRWPAAHSRDASASGSMPLTETYRSAVACSSARAHRRPQLTEEMCHNPGPHSSVVRRRISMAERDIVCMLLCCGGRHRRPIRRSGCPHAPAPTAWDRLVRHDGPCCQRHITPDADTAPLGGGHHRRFTSASAYMRGTAAAGWGGGGTPACTRGGSACAPRAPWQSA